jgi:hypothetical protein
MLKEPINDFGKPPQENMFRNPCAGVHDLLKPVQIIGNAPSHPLVIPRVKHYRLDWFFELLQRSQHVCGRQN